MRLQLMQIELFNGLHTNKELKPELAELKKGLWCYKLALMWVSLYEYATGHTRATDAILDENSWYVEKWLCVSANFVNVAITMDD